MIHEEIFKSKFAQETLIWFMNFMSESIVLFEEIGIISHGNILATENQ